MDLPPLKIGDFTQSIPIIQGGMGIGVSRSHLASAVANAGGIGVISGVQIGFEEEDFETNCKGANIRALKKEIRKARKKSPKGVIGVNILHAMTDYKDMILAAVEEKIDLIISGAGLPVDLPEFVNGTKTLIVPIVSSAKAAFVISKLWDKKYNRTADAIIVEGPEAGGHLGFSENHLEPQNKPNLLDIVKSVKEATKEFAEKHKKRIPIIAAGGIFDGRDIAAHLKNGAEGVQMATRFVATEECDAHINFKNAYINAKKEDIKIIKSPVGMPGRAINNLFVKNINQKQKINKCYNCLKPCNPADTPYCISKALINAVLGKVNEGLVFAGFNAYRINEITNVDKLISELLSETKKYLSGGV